MGNPIEPQTPARCACCNEELRVMVAPIVPGEILAFCPHESSERHDKAAAEGWDRLRPWATS